MILVAWLAGGAYGQPVTLESPNNRVKLVAALVEREGETRVGYRVYYDDALTLDESTVSFELKDGPTVGRHLQQASPPVRRSEQAEWRPVYGQRSVVSDCYNEVTLHCVDKAAGFGVRLVFRCYDAGVAYKTTLSGHDPEDAFVLKGERGEFRFLSDHTAWCTSVAQGEYTERRLSGIAGEVARPLVVELDGDRYAAIGEAGLVDFSRMRLAADKETDNCLRTQLSGPVCFKGSVETPWRVVMLGGSAGELLENSDIFLNLAEPCQIADTSWVRPGKVLREITLTDAGARASIDFAARHNFQFVEFDAGWYGHEYDEQSDAMTVTLDPRRSSGPFDLQTIIDYASQRGIGVILYVNRKALTKQLDEILPLYREWGVSGVKFGFVEVGSQRATAWLHDAVRKAADHQLMVDIHDEYRPTGFSRTYPNLMTQEGVRGDEESPAAEQTLVSLFTRCLAGATDFTVCYFNPRVNEQWTHAHQLAKPVCFYSPWQFLFWYDTPLADQGSFDSIQETPELEFFDHMPTVWDETRVIHGRIGEYAVIARRSGDEWFVGALNGATDRTLELELGFLDSTKSYTAHIYSDDQSAGGPTGVKVTRTPVTSQQSLTLTLLSNGGQALRIAPKGAD